MKRTAKRLFSLLISTCLLLSSCSPHNTMLKTAKLSAGDIDSISYLSNIASVSLTEEEQTFMIRILDKARVTEADPSEEGAGAGKYLGTSTFFKMRLKDGSEDAVYEPEITFGIDPAEDKGYPATMKVAYTFAEIQRQRERGVPQEELVTERTFTFWIDKNAFAQEEYENVVLNANERAHEITGHAF